MNKNMIIGLAAFGGLLLVGGIVINQNKDKEKGTNTESEVTVSEASEEPTTPKVSVPSEFPTYPGASIARASETDAEDRNDYSVSLTTNDALNDVFKWYANALATNGWSIKSDKNVAGYRIIQGVNKNLYTSLQATQEDDTVTISQHMRINKE